ncbi:MAG: InlB B-repeat-containing protein, partial [Parabacteroides distasonis]|nr:InlB B-repeat-containing protein [Parabacteroides distasonis]
YNPNGDDVQGEMKPVVYQMTLNTTPENEKPVVDEVKYTREGYNFAGWNTSPDGDGDKYMPGDRIDITDTTNLYAMWVSTQAVITDVVINNGNNVTINWSDVDDASGYWIYRHKMDDSNAEFDKFEDEDKIGEAGADTLFYIDSELEAGT